jgi:diguanylate cyclase (GGDEF)-like protein
MPRIRVLGLALLHLALWCVAFQELGAQSLPLPEHPRYVVQKIPEQLGLSTITATSLAQDAQGFLWIGTQNGLFRYDGSNVTRFADKQGLGSDRINEVFASRGDVWVFTDLGIWRYEQGRFKEFPLPGGHKLVPDVHRATVDQDNQVWAIVDDGLLLRINADHPEDFEIVPGEPLRLLALARDGSILVATQSKVGRIPRGGRRVEVFSGELPDLPVVALISDGSGDVWARTAKHFSRWDGKGKRWMKEDADLPYADVMGFPTVTPGGDILLPTDHGLYRRWHGRWEAIGEREGLETNGLYAAMEDRDGTIWLGYGGNGVGRWPGPDEWMGWTKSEGLPDSVVWSIVRDGKKRLWVGTNAGLSVWDPSRHKWRNWIKKDGLPGDTIQFLALAPDETLWMLSPLGHLGWMDLKSGRLHRINALDSRGRHIAYTGLVLGPNGTVWASGNGLIDQYKNVNGRTAVSRIPVPDLVKKGVNVLQITPRGVVWGAGHAGVSRFDGKQWRLIGANDGLFAESVMTIGGATADDIWLGYYESNGLTHVHLDENGRPHVNVYKMADGLSSNAVSLMASDHEGNLWVGADRGLSIIHPDGTIGDLSRSSGLLWDDVNSDAFYEDADGGIFIGTSRGLAYRRPNRPLPKWTSWPTVITSATFAGRERLFDGHPQISYRDGAFEAYFSRPAIDSPPAQTCRYQLQGLDPEPVETTLRQVRYSALPAGDFTFSVSCGCARRGWSAPATWSFTIQPPWWQRLWFRGGLVLLLILAVAGITRIRTHALEKQRFKLEEAVAARSAELREANKRLEEMSLTDPLTGAHNRRFFDLTVPRDAQQTLRAYQTAAPTEPPRDRDLVFFIVDLDHFKALNDNYGHAAGDEVLVAVTRRLASVIRETDVLVRWGGEEFLVVSQSANADSAQYVARRMLDVIGERPFETSDGLFIFKTCSIGWAIFPWIGKLPAAVSIDEIVKLTDRALYMAKQDGRNRAIGLYPNETLENESIYAHKARPRVVEILGPAPVAEHR